ncbi:MAG: hypothetical protein KKA64_04725, partial [Nanoarchaeota archaeon]|nr:hypothetical protein [Nanoarchaeota archaeon]
GNHMLSRYSNCDPAYPDYWTSEGLMGYLYKQEQSSTYRLDRCWSELRKEHFTSKDCTAEGGTLNDVLGYAYSSQNTNTSSVYRCYWKEKNEYFDSLNSNCEGHIVNSTLGWFLKSGSSCTPSCTGKCGGSNGCSGTCANTCSGTTPYCYHNVSCVQCLTNINCPTGQTCSNGVCPQTNPQNNIKNMNLYSSKEAFLISDKNWKDVLPLVPLTTWTQQQGDTSPCQRGYGTPENVCVYPTLIYHEETTGFDADSIIYFFQQYTPSRVSIIGTTPQELNNLLIAQPELGAGLTQDKVQRININNYLSYWQEYESVVYVEDNYELALMASTYASLINAPLIIKGSTLDTDVSFANRKVICVGSVTRTCNENYNLEQLQKKYVEMTNTDKIILVNPNDLNIKVTEQFQPEKSAGPISEIYSKTSLASPILASAKHEVILSIELDTLGEGVDEETIRVNVIKIDDFIGEKIGGWNIDEGYLTILATPDAIESRFYQKVYDLYWLINADTARYSSHDEDTILEFATGRIFGISISDISSYISRDLFNHIINSGDKIFLLAGDFAPEIAETMVYSQKIYPLYQYSTEDFIEYEGCCPYVSPDMYKNKFFVQYRDHGNHNWLGISSTQLPKLDNTFFVTSACSTCIYYDYKKPELFCVQALRKGALGYIGMHVGGGPFINYQYLISAFSNNISVGKAWNGALMSQYSSIEEGADDPSNGVGLLGDPTINLHSFSNRLPQSELVKLDNENYLLNLKVMKIPVEFSYKGNELATDTFISSSFINSDAFIYTFKSFYPPPGIEEVHVNGLIKIGPVEKGYNRVKFFDDHIYSRIYERESLNNEQEILWITFSPYSEFFNYDISEPSSDFQDYPFKFKIEK